MISRVQNCLHPRVVLNKYTGERVTVRCGHCDVCVNARAATWVQRLVQECQQHKYTFFATLQYDEQHVPQFVRLDNGESLKHGYIDNSTGEVIFLEDVPIYGISNRILQNEIDFINETKVLNVLSKRDIQLHIKSLRKKVYEEFGERIRYYVCGEYGPQTYRPHYHILYFFDSSLLAKEFPRLLSESWQHGAVFDPHNVSSSACEYVASYVNCTSRLPQIYLHPSVRPFTLFSKKPIIGFYQSGCIDLRKLFLEASLNMRLFVEKSRKFVDVPLWRTLQSGLFPLIPRYRLLDDAHRVLLYESLLHYFINGKSVEETIRKELNTYFYYPTDGIIRRYYETILYRTGKLGIQEFSTVTFERFVRACYKVYKNAVSFNVDVHFYVTKILEFYEKKELLRLNDYYEFQQEYFMTAPPSDACLFDYQFVLSVINKSSDELADWQKIYLAHHGVSINPKVDLDLYKCRDYQAMVTLHTKISYDTNKSKKSNDYLLANKDKFGNIVKYKNL